MRKHVGKVEVLVYPVYCYTSNTRLTNPILNVIELFKTNKKNLVFNGFTFPMVRKNKWDVLRPYWSCFFIVCLRKHDIRETSYRISLISEIVFNDQIK